MTKTGGMLAPHRTRMGQYRVSEELFERLVRSAKARGVSFSEEVRRRLEASFARDGSLVVIDALRLIEQFVVENA